MSGGFIPLDGVCNGTDIGTVTASTTGTTLTAGSGAGTKGSWVQLISSTASDTTLVEMMSAASPGDQFQIDIGVGAAGSEKTIVSNFLCKDAAYENPSAVLLPLDIPSGTRIAARCASSSGSNSCTLNLILFDGSFLEDGIQGYDDIGLAYANQQDVTCTTANSKSAWVQLISSTTRDYYGLVLMGSPYNGGSDNLVDAGIGASGSEVTIIPNCRFITGSSNEVVQSAMSGLIPIHIPSGTRVAIRLQSSATGGHFLGLLAAYK